MVLKIYGHPISTCSKRVAVVAEELNIPYELITIDFSTGQHKTPSYVLHQPFGQVPYIDDDGFELYESRAITRYLATKYAGKGASLIPIGDAKKVAKFEQAASVEMSNYDPSASGLVGEAIFKPMFGGTTDPIKVEELKKTLNAKLDAYETILASQKYVAGDELTIVDLWHLSYGTLIVEALKLDYLTSRPNVARWWSEISNRPSWKAVKDGIPAKSE